MNHPHPVHTSQVDALSRSFGYRMQYLSYDQWQAQLINTVQSKENPLYTLRPFFLQKWSDEQLTIPELYL